jgi:hypothetical protein
MKRLIPLVLPVLLAACTEKKPEAPAATEAATASAAASETPAAPASTLAAAARVSSYTSLKDCEVVDSNADEDWSVSRCSGPGGWALQIDYGDARDDAQLLPKGKAAQPLNLSALTRGAFNGLGDTVEWRGASADKPSALILRNAVSEDPEDSSRVTASLLVVDLAQGCVVAQVRPQAGQNEAARLIADGPKRACLKGGT